MKLLLSCIFISFFFGLSAQDMPHTGIQPEYYYRYDALRDKNQNDSMLVIIKKYLEVSNKPAGVIRLSQDNMPCVVPNMKLMTPIPNAWKKDSVAPKAPIPNPYKRIRPWVIPIANKKD